MKEGYLVEVKLRGKWQPMMKWKDSIAGWSPAVFKKKKRAVNFKKSLEKKGLGVGFKEGKILRKIVPVRVIPVTYTVRGKPGKRTFDFHRRRKKK